MVENGSVPEELQRGLNREMKGHVREQVSTSSTVFQNNILGMDKIYKLLIPQCSKWAHTILLTAVCRYRELKTPSCKATYIAGHFVAP